MSVLRQFRSIWSCGIVTSLFLLTSEVAIQAGPPKAGRDYPIVIGATGRPYGPTQAHYQYQRRYGRPWHGGSGGSHYYRGTSSGFSASVAVHPYYFSGYSPFWGPGYPIYTAPNFGTSYFYSGPVFPSIGVYSSSSFGWQQPFLSPAPYQINSFGQVPLGNGFNNQRLVPRENDLNFLEQQPAPVVEASTPEQQARALRERVLGDEDFARTDYRNAGEHYLRAARIAPDQADARYRYALTLAFRSRFDEAVEQLKLAAELDMEWPARGEVTLDQLFDLTDPDDWELRDEKNRVKTRIAEWTNRDIRDPNRLFLLAAVMVLDGDVRARGLLETAIRLNGVERHLVAFLTPLMDDTIPGDNDQQRQPIQPLVVDPVPKNENFIPPPPAANRGEIIGEERERRVFEARSKPNQIEELIPPAPGLPGENSLPEDGPTLPPPN